jgi:hypothetical protein
MENRVTRSTKPGSNRRAFLKRGDVVAGAATLGSGLLEGRYSTFAEEGPQEKSARFTLSSAEVRRLWEEPSEAISQNQRDAVGILAIYGAEDVNSRILSSAFFLLRGILRWR